MNTIKYPLLILIAVSFAACSVKVEDKGGDKKKPRVSRNNSPKSQPLLVGNFENPNLPSNVVKAYSVKTDELTYSFPYTAKEDAFLHYTAQALLAGNCPGKPYAHFTLIAEKPEATGGSESEFLVLKGMKYNFQVRVTDTKGCESIFISFTVGKELIADAQIGADYLNEAESYDSNSEGLTLQSYGDAQ